MVVDWANRRAKALVCYEMEKKLAPRKTTTVQPQPQRKIPSNEGGEDFLASLGP